eukprot:s6815_g6.t1
MTVLEVDTVIFASDVLCLFRQLPAEIVSRCAVGRRRGTAFTTGWLCGSAAAPPHVDSHNFRDEPTLLIALTGYKGCERRQSDRLAARASLAGPPSLAFQHCGRGSGRSAFSIRDPEKFGAT